MTHFYNSLDRLKFAGLCLLCYGLILQSGRLVAAGPEPVAETEQTGSDLKPLRAEKPPSARKPRPETPAERRERIRYRAAHGMGSMPNLIGIPQIQRELKLSPAQQQEIAEQTRRIHLYLRAQYLDVVDLPEQQQTAAMRKLRVLTQPVVEKKQTELLNVLTDEQRARLLGISLQMRGPQSLIDREVIELLDLTDEQVESILAILEEHDAKLRKLVAKSPTGSKPPLVEIQSVNSRKRLNEKVEEQILAVLTESQREKFKELQGKSYVAQPDGRLPTPIEPSDKEANKTLKELVPDK